MYAVVVLFEWPRKLLRNLSVYTRARINWIGIGSTNHIRKNSISILERKSNLNSNRRYNIDFLQSNYNWLIKSETRICLIIHRSFPHTLRLVMYHCGVCIHNTLTKSVIVVTTVAKNPYIRVSFIISYCATHVPHHSSMFPSYFTARDVSLRSMHPQYINKISHSCHDCCEKPRH